MTRTFFTEHRKCCEYRELGPAMGNESINRRSWGAELGIVRASGFERVVL